MSREEIVALGDTSRRGISIKAQFVMDLMDSRLQGLGLTWAMVSRANVYTAHSITEVVPEIILSRMGTAAIHGVHWHFSRPPIEEIEFEMDVLATRVQSHCN